MCFSILPFLHLNGTSRRNITYVGEQPFSFCVHKIFIPTLLKRIRGTKVTAGLSVADTSENPTACGTLSKQSAIAFANGQPIRVIVNEGLRRPTDMLGQESSKVDVRKLDEAGWLVVNYDAQTAAQRLVRQATTPTISAVALKETKVSPEPVRRFVDQFWIEPR
jgi:hypothetical protein